MPSGQASPGTPSLATGKGCHPTAQGKKAFFGLIEGVTMKSRSMQSVLLGVLLCMVILLVAGCGAQLGETRAEGSRRHSRVSRINNQAMMSDLDRLMLWDKPSRLTDKRIP